MRCKKKKTKKNWLLLSLLVNYERANKWWEKTKTSMQGSDDGIDFPRGKERQTERWRKLMMASRCFSGKRLLWHILTLKCSTAYRWQSWSTRKYNERGKLALRSSWSVAASIVYTIDHNAHSILMARLTILSSRHRAISHPHQSWREINHLPSDLEHLFIHMIYISHCETFSRPLSSQRVD